MYHQSQVEQGQFSDELKLVDAKLVDALDALYSPLSDLTQLHLRQLRPLVRATVVLAVAVGTDEIVDLPRQRVELACAVEMLRLALSLHKLLVDSSTNAGHNDTPDKPVLGSLILAGDYCFSQAAAFAARTENPTVVQLFSQALTVISEGQLRALFDGEQGGFAEDGILFETSVQAAALLANISTPLTGEYQKIFARRPIHFADQLTRLLTVDVLLSPPQRTRLLAVSNWLQTQSSNGLL